MTDLWEAVKVFFSGRYGFYLLIIIAVLLTVATGAWLVSLFMEVTKKRASKLSIKYGRADKEENKFNIGKHVIFGILLIGIWVIFTMVI